MNKQNFKISIPLDSSPSKELQDMGISKSKSSDQHFKEMEVCEPLVATQNPSITSNNSDVGQYQNIQLVWESKKQYPIGTKVITADGTKYHVSSKAPSYMAGLILYNLTNDKG
ncbi:hypothetical protein [Apilactobacillus micheneri]|nr:hypothetical protein [Apilactobacillus micheneri]